MKRLLYIVLGIICLYSCQAEPGDADYSIPYEDSMKIDSAQVNSIVVRKPSLEEGKQLFETNCTACHKMGEVIAGPDLTGTRSRWNNDSLLVAFIQNSDEVIKIDPYARALFVKFNETIMPPSALSKDEIEKILTYIDSFEMPAAP